MKDFPPPCVSDVVRRPLATLFVQPVAIQALAILGIVALTLGAASSARALDLEPWDRVLRAHARSEGFDYAGLLRDEPRRADLRAFLAEAAEMPASEPLASWLNVYNALVIASILDHRPLEGVMRTPGFFDHARHRVAGRDLTLDDIEHRVIRIRFPDARVHAALICGARSCPPLHGRAFRSDGLDATLDALARGWLSTERHLRIEGGVVYASAIFSWYRADFERDGGSVIGWLRRYAPWRMSGVADGARVAEIPYDWSLNTPR